MEHKIHKQKPVPLCFRCPVCGGRTITKQPIDKFEPMKLLQWTCNLCRTPFGPIWKADEWSTGPGVILVGPEPATASVRVDPVLRNTLELLNRSAVSKGELAYQLAKGLISAIFAGACIFLEMRGYFQ